MCGIHLILDKYQQLDSPSAITTMMQAGVHRGPDAQHYHRLREESLWLAGNRLQIIDHNPAANQPMNSAAGRYMLVYNGEIYNFYELRNQLLQAGEQFTTHSDTEVLLKLLIREGKKALGQLNGMFAFAFYDRQEKKLLAARDRFGMKPLYYYEDASWFILSSETRSLMASGLPQKTLDAAQIDHYLQFKYAAPGKTFFKDVHQLLPGYVLEKTADQSATITPFDTPAHPKSSTLSSADIVKNTKELLTDAVVKHLVADVPCGLFLSGGVDSTLLLAIIQQEGLHPVPTFSIVNNPADKSFGTHDYYYAAKAAKMYGNVHYELPLTPSLMAEQQENFLRYLDQPIADSGAFMTYLLSMEAKKAVGVVLSGAGADELFAGYNRHQAFYWYLKHYQKLPLARKALALTKHLPTGFSHPLRKQFRLLKKLGDSLTDNPGETFENFVSLHMPWQKQQASSKGIFQAGDNIAQNFVQALNHDLQQYLPHDVLAISDRMSMACSLEMRMPYLDAPLADFTQSIPAVTRIAQGKKWILKQMLENYGGKIFTQRSKEGLGLPLGAWMRTSTFDFLTQPLKNNKNLIYRRLPFDSVQMLIRSHMSEKADYGQELWALGILSAWIAKNFGEE